MGYNPDIGYHRKYMIRTHDNYDLTDHNTFAIHAKCGQFMEYTEAGDIPFVLSCIRPGVEWVHIGAGSNLLFTRDFPGIVLHSAIKGIEVVKEHPDAVTVRVGAGETMDDIVKWACQRELWGLENLSGIPGEAGSSAVQNVGAYGTEAADTIESVLVFDTIEREFTQLRADVCHFGYRTSIFKEPDSKGRYIVHAVDFRLRTLYSPTLTYGPLKEAFTDAESLTPADVREKVLAVRASKLPDPAVCPSAGSFFKNPVVGMDVYDGIAKTEGMPVPKFDLPGGFCKIPAAWLLDRCGWKGYSEDRVAVWHLQPLVIVNPHRKATGADVVALERKMIESVKARFGISLSPEVEHL